MFYIVVFLCFSSFSTKWSCRITSQQHPVLLLKCENQMRFFIFILSKYFISSIRLKLCHFHLRCCHDEVMESLLLLLSFTNTVRSISRVLWPVGVFFFFFFGLIKIISLEQFWIMIGPFKVDNIKLSAHKIAVHDCCLA